MKNTKNTKTGGALGGPVDWTAWAVEANQPRGSKGRKHSPEIRAKFSAAQRAQHARKRAALAAATAVLKGAVPAPAAYDPLACVTVTERIFAAMQPGSWYATRDMATASGTKYQACKAYAVTWWRAGLLLRTQNPEWKPPARIGGPQEPKWLYRLTSEGEKRHRLAAALL